jgi:transcription antitermination factor NusG
MNLTKPDKNKNWYAIFTKSRFEKKVYERMIENDIEAFLPLIKTVRQWSDRKKTVQLPLIPSYVFVQMNERDLYKAISIPGAVNVLKHLKKPAKVRDYEIENLKILSDSNEKFEITNNVSVVSGDNVEVTKGPFMGLIAVCEKTSSSHRVVVNIESLGSGFSVNIPLSFLRKIEKKSKV